jgi:hypothetical protein
MINKSLTGHCALAIARPLSVADSAAADDWSYGGFSGSFLFLVISAHYRGWF